MQSTYPVLRCAEVQERDISRRCILYEVHDNATFPLFYSFSCPLTTAKLDCQSILSRSDCNSALYAVCVPNSIQLGHNRHFICQSLLAHPQLPVPHDCPSSTAAEDRPISRQENVHQNLAILFAGNSRPDERQFSKYAIFAVGHNDSSHLKLGCLPKGSQQNFSNKDVPACPAADGQKRRSVPGSLNSRYLTAASNAYPIQP